MEILINVICCFSVAAAMYCLLWETELLGFVFGFYSPERRIPCNLSPAEILEKIENSGFSYNVIASQNGKSFFVVIFGSVELSNIPYFEMVEEVTLKSIRISSLKKKKIEKQEKFFKAICKIFETK